MWDVGICENLRFSPELCQEINANKDKGEESCGLNKAKLWECNDDNCSMGPEKCTNRFITNIGQYELFVRDEGILGLGLVLGRKPVPAKDIFLGELTGRVRLRDDSVVSNYIAEFGDKLMLDGEHSRNPFNYLNHSCRPNAKFVLWYSAGGEPRLCVFSTKKIKPNTPLTICYGKTATLFFKDGICL